MRAVIGILAALCLGTAAQAKVLEVGAGAAYALPSQAVAAAQAGDTIRIAPGRYVDCAVIHQDRLTIEGTGPDVVLADKACAGKAILVIAGRDVTVRNLTLRGARVPDRNGAGIRAEGGALTVEDTHFVDNENGLMTAGGPAMRVRIAGGSFVGNGRCDPVCAHGIYAGHIALLRVERTRFAETRVGHHIKSRAARTEILNAEIGGGTEDTASYLIDIPNGGGVLIQGNELRKSARSANPGIAISIGAEGATNATDSIVVRDNRFANLQARPVVFVVNRTPVAARLEGNRFTGVVIPLDGPGTTR